MIPSLIAGTNADLMRQVAALYIEPDDVVVDATFGEGMFWRSLPEIPVVAHDLYKGDGVDLRALPEAAASVDVLAIDPPYRLTESTDSPYDQFVDAYGLGRAPELTNNAAGVTALKDLYAGGIAEASRVLTRRGRLLVKCQDFIDGKRYVAMCAELIGLCEAAGLPLIDLFVLHSGTGPRGPWETQHRSRRAHSYLIVAGRQRWWKRREPLRHHRVLAGMLAFDSGTESGDSG